MWFLLLIACIAGGVGGSGTDILPPAVAAAQLQIDCAALANPIKKKRAACMTKNADIEVDLCVYFASDYHFVMPFLIHHLSLGFTRIWIYNNDEHIAWYNHPAVLCLVAEEMVDIQPWFGELNLHKAFDNCFLQKIPGRTHQSSLSNVWGAVFDIDELLVLHKGETCINSFMAGRNAPSLALNWAFFTPEVPLTDFQRTGNKALLSSTSDRTKAQQIILPHDMLTRRMYENGHIKTITRVSCVERWVHDHAPQYKSDCPFGEKIVDPEGHYFKANAWTPWVDNSYPNAQLNHYWTLSMFDFMRKIHRGKGGNYPRRDGQARNTAEFHNHGRPGRMAFVNDTSFLDYYGDYFRDLKLACPHCFYYKYFYL